MFAHSWACAIRYFGLEVLVNEQRLFGLDCCDKLLVLGVEQLVLLLRRRPSGRCAAVTEQSSGRYCEYSTVGRGGAERSAAA